ncbi:MAG: mechanosensitive ion channel [Rubellimicrobium sp.]|nr:mechanosensitive ion channel [Rubellimicrobium sp.]
MHFFRSLVVLILLALTLSTPAGAQDVDGPSGTISTERDSGTDDRIAVRIREILQEIGGYDEITVTVAEGVVTLSGTTDSATAAATLVSLVSRIEGIVTIRNEMQETTDLVRRLNPAMDRFMSRVQQLGIMAPLFGIALASFLALTFTGLFLARRRWPWDRIAPNAFIADLYRQIVILGFSFVGMVVALDVMDASALLSTIIGAAGLVGLAIGFAVRDTVENYIASIFLSIRQPFRPNDTVDIDGTEGKVIRLTSRATILLSFDGNHIRIPNATVFKAKIVNFTENDERRFLFRLGIEVGNDLNRARLLAVETIQGLPFILAEPAAQVWIEDVRGNNVELVLTGWIDQRKSSLLLARGEAMRQVKLAFEASGIGLNRKDYSLSLDPVALEGVTRPGPRAPDPAQAARPRTATVAVPEVEDVGRQIETRLDEMIEAERAQSEKQDLLSPASRSE